MKAAQISEFGDASVVHVAEVDKPKVKPTNVLVEVHASSLNPFDSAMRSGWLQKMMPLKLPITLGGDVAGVVSEAGTGAETWKPGDKVWGQSYAVSGDSGAWAEFAVAPAGKLGLMPNNVTFEEAASLVLVGVSAWQALVSTLKLAAGEKIFINGAGGGIGSVAVQIAKHLGAHVTASARGADEDLLRGLGAEAVIDYQKQDFTSALSDFDVLFDTVRSDDFNKALGILKRGGRGLWMTGQADPARAKELGVTAYGQGTQVTTEALDALRELVEAGAVKPMVGKVFPLNRTREAFEALENGSVRGKVVIRIVPEN